MSLFAKSLMELQRNVQQAFLNVDEYFHPLREFTQTSSFPLFDFEKSVELICQRMVELRKMEKADGELEVYQLDLQHLVRSVCRLKVIVKMIQATETVRDSPDVGPAKSIFKATTDVYRSLLKKYPHEKDDLESRAMKMVHASFVNAVSAVVPVMELIEPHVLSLHKLLNFTATESLIHRALGKVRNLIAFHTLALEKIADLEGHGDFSTEKAATDLKKLNAATANPMQWLDSFRFEAASVSSRVIEVVKTLQWLIEEVVLKEDATEQSRRDVGAAVASAVGIFVEQARPTNHDGAEDLVYHNDCSYLTFHLERFQHDSIYRLPGQMTAFNFGEPLAALQTAARSALKEYLKYVKLEYLTWTPEDIHTFLTDETEAIAAKLNEFDRFVGSWKEIASQKTYVTMATMTAAHLLLQTASSFLNYGPYDEHKCCRAVTLMQDVLDRCDAHLEGSMRTEKILVSAEARLQAVKFCLQRSKYDIDFELQEEAGVFTGVLKDAEVKRLASRFEAMV
ncbi:hypothetical protein M3Y99_01429500 [Aphelenchoides fujianensis]|nr:hypothetical protein M3Y99_01429500 [Aphelenchoides fujianensis]